MRNKLLILFIGFLVLAAVGFFGYSQFVGNQANLGEEVMMESGGESKVTGEERMEGKMIAGKNSSFREFNKSEYDKAIADGKIVFLDFYANWCPICRAEAPELVAGFNELERGDIVGFRVNFKDDETDEDEKNLAQEFSIPYQHTKVILKNGKEVRRSGEQWNKEKFLAELGGI